MRISTKRIGRRIRHEFVVNNLGAHAHTLIHFKIKTNQCAQVVYSEFVAKKFEKVIIISQNILANVPLKYRKIIQNYNKTIKLCAEFSDNFASIVSG